MRGKSHPRVKRVRAKGRDYYYFDTGTLNEAGKPVYKRLPDPKERNFGAVYASLMAHVTQRANIRTEITLSRMIDLYQRGATYGAMKPASKKLYDIQLRKIDDAFRGAPANAVERRDTVLLLDSLAGKPATANVVLAVLRALYKWGRDRGHVTIDPAAEIDTFDVGEHDPWPEALLDEALASDDDRVRLATAMLYFTAQRIGDVCLMRWSDIRDGRFEFTQQKTGRMMSVPVHASLAAILATTPRTGLTIMASAAGKPFHVSTVRNWLQAFAAERSYRIVPHGLRKNAVNSLLEAGCSTGETSAISGQSLAVVEHYAKRRANVRMGSAAILKWEGHKVNRKTLENRRK
nr:tyrosine-type recombinase/integrase [Sphingomonas laterariae]